MALAFGGHRFGLVRGAVVDEKELAQMWGERLLAETFKGAPEQTRPVISAHHHGNDGSVQTVTPDGRASKFRFSPFAITRGQKQRANPSSAVGVGWFA